MGNFPFLKIAGRWSEACPGWTVARGPSALSIRLGPPRPRQPAPPWMVGCLICQTPGRSGRWCGAHRWHHGTLPCRSNPEPTHSHQDPRKDRSRGKKGPQTGECQGDASPQNPSRTVPGTPHSPCGHGNSGSKTSPGNPPAIGPPGKSGRRYARARLPASHYRPPRRATMSNPCPCQNASGPRSSPAAQTPSG